MAAPQSYALVWRPGRLGRDTERLREAARETLAFDSGESSVRVHQPIHDWRHFPLGHLFRRFTRLLLRPLPFGEIQDLAAFVDIVLNEPGHGRDVGGRRPLGVGAVTVEASALRQRPCFRRVPGGLPGNWWIDMTATVGDQLHRQQRNEAAARQPPESWNALHRLHPLNGPSLLCADALTRCVPGVVTPG